MFSNCFLGGHSNQCIALDSLLPSQEAFVKPHLKVADLGNAAIGGQWYLNLHRLMDL